MSSPGETTIRVPISLRERVKVEAARRGLKQADLIELALRELDQAGFLGAVSAVDWDEEAVAEAREWDEAELSGPMDPWKPRR